MPSNRLWRRCRPSYLVLLLYPDAQKRTHAETDRVVGRMHLFPHVQRSTKQSTVRRSDLQGAFALAGGVPA
jgi:hypothetical protein